MAVIRQPNWLGGQRVDVPHLRGQEFAIAGDFDALAGVIMAGRVATVVRGFTFLTGGLNQDASALKLMTAGGALLHFEASESGTVFTVPDDRPAEVLNAANARVEGNFVPNTTNFVGIDLRRSADDSTADIVQFLDTDTDTETPATVALARTLDYKIVVSTTEFSATPTVLPVAKVVTDAANKVTSITDARQLFFRLGRGGSSPEPINPFGWPGGRNEADPVLGAVGGDRSVLSLKNFVDAVMTRLWEVGGGEYWYSPTADRNVRLGANAVFTSTGEPFEIVSNNVHWTGLVWTFDNSTGWYNEVNDQTTSVAGLTDLADGEVLYADLDRTQNRTVSGGQPIFLQKGTLATLGVSAVPGARFAVVWRIGNNFYFRDQYLPIGSMVRVATTAANGVVRLSATPFAPLAPLVATDTGGLIMGMSGFSRFGTSTSGDLSVGGLTGDQNIHIASQTSNYRTTIEGSSAYSFGQQAALRVKQNGDVANQNDAFDVRIIEWQFSQLGVVGWIEGTGAQGYNVVPRPPLPPAPTGADLVTVKKFWRKSLYWATNCRVLPDSDLGTVTMSGTAGARVLTSSTNTVTTLDGVVLALNDRVLIKDFYPGILAPDFGVYVVTQLANGTSLPLKMQRASDLNTSATLFENVAVKITSGTTWGNTSWRQAAPNIVLGTTDQSWLPYLGPKEYRIQECTMWHDGSVTIIAESPVIAVA